MQSNLEIGDELILSLKYMFINVEDSHFFEMDKEAMLEILFSSFCLSQSCSLLHCTDL